MRTPLLIALAALPAFAYTFQAPAPLTVSRQGLSTVAVVSTDFNGDGIADVATVNLGVPPLGGLQASSVGVLLGTRGGAPGNLQEFPLEGNAVDLVAGDFNGDGVPDIAALSVTAGGARICLLPGSGNGVFSIPICSAAAGSPSRMTAVDLNRDNRLDLILLRAFDSRVSAYLNNGSGAFSAGAEAEVTSPAALATADWNRDGIPDAAVISRSGVLTLLLSSPTAPFQMRQSRSIGPAVNDVVVLDLNRDGIPDILLTDPQAATVSHALGRTDPNAFLGPLNSQPFPARGLSFRLADINADSHPEVIVATAAGMMVIASNGDGTLTIPNPPGAPPVSTGSFAAGDADGDGRIDLFVAAPSTGGTGTFFLKSRATETLTFLEVTPATATYGARSQITIRVRMAEPAPVLLPLSGASAELLDGDQVLQTVPMPPATSGTLEVANVRFETALPAGTRDLRARFRGSSVYLGSVSPPVRTAIAPSESFVRFQGPPMDVSYTQGLRLNATVIGPLVVANEGIVRLLVNGSVIAQSFVNGGVSQLFLPPSLPLGRIRVQLAYEGTNFLPSRSEELEFNVTGGQVTAASAASYRPSTAPDSLAVLAIPGLVRPAGVAAAAVPWPLELAGVQVEVRENAGGTARKAGLTYAGSGQVNVHLPAGLPPGAHRVVAIIDGVEAASGQLQIAPAAPGVFTVDGSGAGAPAAFAALYGADGTPRDMPVFACANGSCLPAPLDTGGEGEILVLTLFGTGWRGANSVGASIAGVPVEVQFSGAQPSTPGLDQVNIRVPRSLAGRGQVELVISADATVANAVRIWIR